jgi:hypothetical protein
VRRMQYWILGLVSVACFTAMFTLLLFLVNRIRPETFKVRAALTKWISVEVELLCPEPSRCASGVDPDRHLAPDHAVIGDGRPDVEAFSGDVAERLGALPSGPELDGN